MFKNLISDIGNIGTH